MTLKEWIIGIIIPIGLFVITYVITFSLRWLDRNRNKSKEQEERKYRHRQEEQEKEYLEQSAREILIKNANEKQYLLLAQFAYFLNPVKQHGRTIYNVFNCCSQEQQKEILKQAGIVDLNLDKYNKENFLTQLWDYFISDMLDSHYDLLNEMLLDSNRIQSMFINGITNSGKICLVGDKWIENEEKYLDKNLYHIDKNGSYKIRECYDIGYRLIDYLALKTCKNEKEKQEYYKKIKQEERNSEFPKDSYFHYTIPDTYEDFINMHSPEKVDFVQSLDDPLEWYKRPLDYYFFVVDELLNTEFIEELNDGSNDKFEKKFNQQSYMILEIILTVLYCIKKDIIPTINCNEFNSQAVLSSWSLHRLEDIYYQTVLLLYLVYRDKLNEKDKNI